MLSSSAYAQSVPITQIMVAITVADKNPDLISFHMFDKYRLESICPETRRKWEESEFIIEGYI